MDRPEVVVISGASKRVGRAVARRFAAGVAGGSGALTRAMKLR